jgi:hypothetical protein
MQLEQNEQDEQWEQDEQGIGALSQDGAITAQKEKQVNVYLREFLNSLTSSVHPLSRLSRSTTYHICVASHWSNDPR